MAFAAPTPLSPPLQLNAFSHRVETSRVQLGGVCPWLGHPSRADSTRRKRTSPLVRLSPLPDPFFLLDVSNPAVDVGYSPASYYTSLGLFVISVPGLWSLIKRSVKSKVVQKTFVKEDGTAMAPNQVAGEILSFFTRNNFSVSDRGETVTFEGMMIPSRGQAALLTFCTCISLGSVALVLSIAVPEGGNNWFWLMTLSPLAGVYYWKRASRKEEIKVKMMLGDNGSLSEILVRGDDQQVEQMRKELKLSEKGMIYVKGIFER
ncbi:protein COFACTOR ASSEMBLY OF COMPLEX C SUBUNIT B CCB1, chloroplastic [Typha angustifolia]|uniref:protein COFACTOR ASSEMBLY OF COMPLEX C SUBUNIT B CCB1, chloroplastic n=1 Tax=Typha angustifolia TaxID=59011 RepID=UPI003C2D46D2